MVYEPKSQVIKPKGIPSAEIVMGTEAAAALSKLSPMERQIKAVNDKWDKEHQAAKDWLNSQPPEDREIAKLKYKDMVRHAAMDRVIAIKRIKTGGDK